MSYQSLKAEGQAVLFEGQQLTLHGLPHSAVATDVYGEHLKLSYVSKARDAHQAGAAPLFGVVTEKWRLRRNGEGVVVGADRLVATQLFANALTEADAIAKQQRVALRVR